LNKSYFYFHFCRKFTGQNFLKNILGLWETVIEEKDELDSNAGVCWP
jgi:hypothetical protein